MTRWGWLVLVPVVLALGAAWLQQSQRAESDRTSVDALTRALDAEKKARAALEEEAGWQRQRLEALERTVQELQERGAVVAFSADGGVHAIATNGAMPLCPSRLDDAQRANGLECVCPPGAGTGTVWGSGPYTADSSICRAAVHAGVIEAAQGGRVSVRPAPGCPGYKGTTSHAVKTQRWKSYEASFFFAGGNGACPAIAGNLCPDLFSGFEAPLPATCQCEEVEAQSVWGTGSYAADSSVCAAAQHAGAIPATGGTVTVRDGKGCTLLEGSTRNGITSMQRGPERRRYFFDGAPAASCTEVPDDVCPATFQSIPGGEPSGAYSCTCLDTPATGSVWGSGIYTRDSAICSAARHAGVLPSGSGRVTLWPAKGCSAYVASEAHGVSSRAWGPYASGSFVFASTASCAEESGRVP